MDQPVLIFGAETRGKIVLDILQQSGLTIYGFLDDTPALQGKSLYNIPVLGRTQDPDLLALLETQCSTFIAYEDPAAYLVLFKQLRAKYPSLKIINAIHPTATLPTHIQLGEGNCIQAGVHIGPEVLISSHCTIEANVTLGCGTVLHDFVHIGASAVIGIQVLLQHHTHIGAAAILNPQITIGANAHVPAGAMLNKDVMPHQVIPDANANYRSSLLH